MSKKSLGIYLFLSLGLIVFYSCASLLNYNKLTESDLFKNYRSEYQKAVELKEDGKIKDSLETLFNAGLVAYANNHEYVRDFDVLWDCFCGNKEIEDASFYPVAIWKDRNYFPISVGHLLKIGDFSDFYKNDFRYNESLETEAKNNVKQFFLRIGDLLIQLDSALFYEKQNKLKEYLESGRYFEDFKAKLPRLFSYLESKDYLKYCSGDLIGDMKDIRTTFLKECDDFEANDVSELIKIDILHLLSNISFFNIPNTRKIIDNGRYRYEEPKVLIEPDYNTRTYAYTLSNYIFDYDSDLLFAIEEGLYSIGYYKNNINRSILDEYVPIGIDVFLNLTLENGENYKSKIISIPIEIVHDSVYIKDRLAYYKQWLIKKRWIDNPVFKNIPYKSYKAFTVELASGIKFKKNKESAKNSNNENIEISAQNDVNSSSTLKELFGSIICEECGKHLALYDCFDPVKNVRVSLCRPCLQKKQQDYNEKYQKALNDIKNL